MMVIGLGKQAGAQKIHQQGLRVEMRRMILEASLIILEHSPAPFLGGIALVDNAFKETALVKGVSMGTHERSSTRKAPSSKSPTATSPASPSRTWTPSSSTRWERT